MVQKPASIVCHPTATSRADRGRHSVVTIGRGTVVSQTRMALVGSICEMNCLIGLSRWRELFDGAHPINDVLVISIYRVDTLAPPSTPHLLSERSANIQVPYLSEVGVRAFVDVCFNSRLDAAPALASFLSAETSGNPLYLQTLLSTLVSASLLIPLTSQVREKTIIFDFDILIWRLDPLALQNHLSDAGLDAYLERLLRSLEPAVVEILKVSELSRLILTADFVVSSFDWLRYRPPRATRREFTE